MATTRKRFLARSAGAGAVLFAGPLAGSHPGRAHASGTSLSAAETRALAAWCDALAPGAAAAGVGDFVNAQLAKHPDDALLGMRYFDVRPPFTDFYRSGLGALDALATRRFLRGVEALSESERRSLVGDVLAGPEDWSGPPAFLFYLATRSDAVDVVYGTPAGYRRIGFPYTPQITPSTAW